MQKKINAALISVFYKDGLKNIIHELSKQGTTIYSTGGTLEYIESLGVKAISVESLTGFPSILGGRVKTLHPLVFGAILGKRNDAKHIAEMKQYDIPEIDLVIVDLYPFEETVKSTSDENAIIEKIDVGGPSMIRAAAKNFNDTLVVASKNDYATLVEMLSAQNGSTTLEQRKHFAIKAFDVCTAYDNAISAYFNGIAIDTPFNKEKKILRYGENPHQQAVFFGNLNEHLHQLHGKELSYNNLADVDAAINLIAEFNTSIETAFAIIKHSNVCGIASKKSTKESWDAALAGDPESAFGGVLITNGTLDKATAEAINEIFFEVIIAPSFDEGALKVLQSKKNRIILQLLAQPNTTTQMKIVLNGLLIQDADKGNYSNWKECGGRQTSATEKEDLIFANIICKHLKSNAIALVKNKQLIGKGCGQTSRIDALRHSIEKARQFNFELSGAALASDAFFPFDDCVKIAHEAGITAFIQPGGSIRDGDSINYCQQNKLAMVITGMRHFKH